jgi:hypothetical protein
VQSEKIVNTMRKNGGKVLFVVYPDEGHGFVRPENNIDFAGRAEELLHEAIGGCFEPWQKAPGAYRRAKVKGASAASALAQAAKTVPPPSALRSPFGARIT